MADRVSGTRTARRRVAIALLAAWVACGAPVAAFAAPALRVVSMNPSLTRMLIALGARDTLVGVDEFSPKTEPSVEHLPRVGGLFDPSLEAVVALQPDLVVVVPSISQRDYRNQLRALGIDVLELRNITLDDVLNSVRELGARVDRADAARARIETIRRTWKEIAARTAAGPERSAVLVLQRDPLYVAGAGSFLDEMLRAAGVENAAAEFAEPYPRVGIEWLIAAAPDIIVDSASDPLPAADYWARWPSIPAVAEARVVAVPAGNVTLPGPHLDRSLQILFDAIAAVDASAQ